MTDELQPEPFTPDKTGADLINKAAAGQELWSPVKGASGPKSDIRYEVSTLGRVKSIKTVKGRSRESFLKPFRGSATDVHKTCVNVNQRRVRVHNLIISTFFKLDPKQLKIHFKDGDPTNCRLDNLLISKRPIRRRAKTRSELPIQPVAPRTRAFTGVGVISSDELDSIKKMMQNV